MPDLPRLDIALDRTGGRAVLRVVGELDLFTASQLTDQLAGAFELADTCVLDLQGLTFVDSTGIRALLSVRRWASRQGRELEVREPEGSARRALELADALRLIV